MAGTNTAPMSVSEYDSDKSGAIAAILEFLKKIKEFFNKKKDDEYSMVYQRLEKAEEALEQLENSSDVNLDALKEIMSLMSGVDEKLQTMSPETIQAEMDELSKKINEMTAKIQQQAGEHFYLKGNVHELVKSQLSKEWLDGLREADKQKLEETIENLPLLKGTDGKLYIGFPDKEGFDMTRMAEIKFESDDKNSVIIGTPTKIPDNLLEYERIPSDPSKSIHNNILEAIVQVYGSEEERNEALKGRFTAERSRLFSEYDKRAAFIQFQQQFTAEQKSGNVVARWNEEDNTFQIYDKKSHKLLTFVKEEDSMRVLECETVKPFVRTQPETVIRKWDNQNGELSMATKPGLDKETLALLGHKMTNMYLANYDIDNESMSKRYEHVLQKVEQRMRTFGDASSNSDILAHQITVAYRNSLVKAAKEAGVQWQIAHETGCITVDLPDGSRVDFGFNKNGIPISADFIANPDSEKPVHKCMMLNSQAYYGAASFDDKETAKAFEQAMGIVERATDIYLQNSGKWIDQAVLEYEAKKSGTKGAAYTYMDKASALMAEFKQRFGCDSELMFRAVNANEFSIYDKLTDTVMNVHLNADGSGRIAQIEFGNLQQREKTISDFADTRIAHEEADFAVFEKGFSDEYPKQKEYETMLAIAACLETEYNKETPIRDGLLSKQFDTDAQTLFIETMLQHEALRSKEAERQVNDSKVYSIAQNLEREFPDADVEYGAVNNGRVEFTVHNADGKGNDLQITMSLTEDEIESYTYTDADKYSCTIPCSDGKPHPELAMITMLDAEAEPVTRKDIASDAGIKAMMKQADEAVEPEEQQKQKSKGKGAER